MTKSEYRREILEEIRPKIIKIVKHLIKIVDTWRKYNNIRSEPLNIIYANLKNAEEEINKILK